MQMVLSVLGSIIVTIIDAMQLLLLVSAIMSWIVPESDNKFVNFIYNITDVILIPARAILDKTGWFSGMPIDMSFLFTVIALWVLEILFLFI